MNRGLAHVAVVAAICGLAAPVSARQAIEYNRQQVAPGVHLFSPNDLGVGNVVAFLSEGEALVVDATATPGTAQQILAGLRDLGVTQVVALVNTHWHDDHIWGNQVFADSFPTMRITAHPATVDGIRDRAIPGLADQIVRLHQRIGERAEQLASGLGPDGVRMDAAARSGLEQRQELFRDAVASLETVRPVLPSPLESESQSFRVGSVDVWVEHLGAGHTPGDLIVRAPWAGVIAVGDLLTEPVPAAAEADLRSWTNVLDSLGTLRETVLIPGHGEVQRDPDYLTAVNQLFRDVIDFVRVGIHAETSLDRIIETADFGGFRRRWIGEGSRENAMFQAFFLEPAIRSTYAALTGG